MITLSASTGAITPRVSSALPISDELRAIASEAVRRMSLHEQRTGLAHDHVMVFPQGIFSEQAILELKRATFSAVVNTEVHSNLLSRAEAQNL